MSVVDGYGYIHISRKAYAEDPFWLEPRTFSRWEAWEDMIQSARHTDRAWSPGAHRSVIQLKRGETRPMSYSFMATRWNWSVKQARNFINLLTKMGRVKVGQRAEDGHTYVLINYETYQGGGQGDGKAGAGAGQARGKKKKEGEEGEGRRKKEKTPPGGGGPLTKRPAPSVAPDLRTAIPDIDHLWAERMRCARRKPNPEAEQKQLDKLAATCREHGPAPVLKAIEDATTGGYQGIFPDKFIPKPGSDEWGLFGALKRDIEERLS